MVKDKTQSIIYGDDDMENFNLLYPTGKQPNYQTLSDDVIRNLSLDHIIQHVTASNAERNMIKRMMTQIECDPDVIRFRCDIFEDIIRFPELRNKMKDLLEQLDFMKSIGGNFVEENASSIWQLVNRLRELEVYIDCITEIKETLQKFPVKSEGLKQLRDYVSSVYNDSGFKYLSEDIKELLTETDEIKSITLGVNLDSMLRPVEVGIMSINKERIEHSGIMKKFNKFIEFLPLVGDLLDGKNVDMTRMRSVGTSAEDDPLMKNLCNAVTDMLGSTVKHLKNKLSRYVNVSGYALTRFIPDFTFYIRWADFCSKIMEMGMPMSRPEILAPEKNSLNSKGIYDLKLAIQNLEGANIDIVSNDFEFATENGIYIMTGPNRGGKTTFTQSIGVLFVLAQNGIFVPAQSLHISPCDNIFTHFPADENQTVNLGRLGEESKRISEIFASATDRSLLLFNESLATTSFTEGLYIAKDVVRAMRRLGARTIFNTHMHELATDLDSINHLDGGMMVASLITGIHEGRRSFKVYIAPPEGISYAKDIAEKYGVTYEQLERSIVH